MYFFTLITFCVIFIVSVKSSSNIDININAEYNDEYSAASMGAPLILTKYNVFEVLQNSAPGGGILIKFFVEWCHHCKELAPKFDTASHEYAFDHPGSDMLFASVDCDQEPMICTRFNIDSYPRLLYLERQEQDINSGFVSISWSWRELLFFPFRLYHHLTSKNIVKHRVYDYMDAYSSESIVKFVESMQDDTYSSEFSHSYLVTKTLLQEAKEWSIKAHSTSQTKHQGSQNTTPTRLRAATKLLQILYRQTPTPDQADGYLPLGFFGHIPDVSILFISNLDHNNSASLAFDSVSKYYTHDPRLLFYRTGNSDLLKVLKDETTQNTEQYHTRNLIEKIQNHQKQLHEYFKDYNTENGHTTTSEFPLILLFWDDVPIIYPPLPEESGLDEISPERFQQIHWDPGNIISFIRLRMFGLLPELNTASFSILTKPPEPFLIDSFGYKLPEMFDPLYISSYPHYRRRILVTALVDTEEIDLTKYPPNWKAAPKPTVHFLNIYRQLARSSLSPNTEPWFSNIHHYHDDSNIDSINDEIIQNIISYENQSLFETGKIAQMLKFEPIVRKLLLVDSEKITGPIYPLFTWLDAVEIPQYADQFSISHNTEHLDIESSHQSTPTLVVMDSEHSLYWLIPRHLYLSLSNNIWKVPGTKSDAQILSELNIWLSKVFDGTIRPSGVGLFGAAYGGSKKFYHELVDAQYQAQSLGLYVLYTSIISITIGAIISCCCWCFFGTSSEADSSNNSPGLGQTFVTDKDLNPTDDSNISQSQSQSNNTENSASQSQSQPQSKKKSKSKTKKHK